MDQLDFDRLLDAMPDAVLVADMESRIVRLAMLAEPSMADIPVAIVSASPKATCPRCAPRP